MWYTNTTKCTDFVGLSFNQIPRGKKQQYFKVLMIKYFKTWHPGFPVMLIQLAWVFAGGINFIGDLFSIKSRTKT